MKFESEVAKLAKIRQELIDAAASMPAEDEVKQIIRDILANGSMPTMQPFEQVSAWKSAEDNR